MPSDYLPGHVYFVQGAIDGPGDTDFAGEWFGFTGKEDMVMFGSSYPHWQSNELTVPERVLGRTARQVVLAKRRAALRHRRRGRHRRTVVLELPIRETTMTVTTTERKPATEHVAVRCVDSDVHPTPRSGELAQYIPEPWRSKYFLKPQGRRPDLLRRPRLCTCVRDARRHLPR